MKDKDLPKPVGKGASESVHFPRLKEVCKRLDEFYESFGMQKSVPPSSMFLGALYGIQKQSREKNPDWMAQVSHSLREIFYNLGLDWTSAFKEFGSTYDGEIGVQKVGEYKNFIEEIAHHNFEEAKRSILIGGNENSPVEITSEIFEKVVLQFGDILFVVLRRQIDALHEIDEIIKMSPSETNYSHINELVHLNPGAKQYYYSKTDEQWLDWLWENGFLDVIKQKAEDPTKYSYRTPELNYLVRMSEKLPVKIVDIILEVPISKDSFNPEVIDQFLRICSSLPVDHLARIVQKIRDEKWAPLLGVFNRWGFEYEKMLKTLAEAKDSKSIIVLAEAILAIRTKEEINKDNLQNDSPFYFNDVSDTKVFEYLINVSDEYAEQAIGLVTRVISDTIQLYGTKSKLEVFETEDWFFLFDVDFFTLKPGLGRRNAAKEDIRELVATIKVFAERLIGNVCTEHQNVRRVYEQYIKPLPDSQLMWRLRLFVLSLCPEVFNVELKEVFFRLFNKSNYYEILVGPEYEKALQKGFSVLSDKIKREYVRQVISYFNEHALSEEDSRQTRHGSKILSVIANQLTKEEKEEAIKAKFKIIPDYEPKPLIGQVHGGIVAPRGVITQEQFDRIPINKIAEKLRNEWTPEKLAKQNTHDDFLNPLNAEGIGNQLRATISKRLQESVDNSLLFFNCCTLDPHYTYSFLRGLYETIKDNLGVTANINWDQLVSLFITIKKSGENYPFSPEKRERDTYGWLSGWSSVHSSLADVIEELLRERDDKIVIDFSRHRDQLLAVINYLLKYPDPTETDEAPTTAVMTVKKAGDQEQLISDPFTLAVNSVRGQAFQAFLLFIYQDGKQFSKESKVKISSDVKKMYEEVLKQEKTRALIFMFGHSLPSFYFRDEVWVHRLLPQIFPEEKSKKHLYIAAWEGYIANNLYKEIFFDSAFQELYIRGLALTGEEDHQREYFVGLKEGIATHLALAFLYYGEYGFDHPLFKAFLEKNDPEQLASFIGFIGRSFISSDDDRRDELFKESPLCKERLMQLWEQVINHDINPKALIEFGAWINLDNGIFQPAWLAKQIKDTLEKTNGALEWDYGLIKSIIHLTRSAPEDTLEIARLYLLEGGVRGTDERFPIHIDDEWFEVFKILYGNPKTKSKTYALIDELIREGGRSFWKLKEIVD